MVDDTTPENGPDAVEIQGHEEGSFVGAPKLMRIASMTRAMLEEIRQAPLDDAGRRRIAEIHQSTLDEMKDVLSPELRGEMNELFTPLSAEDVTEAELRVTQAQLVGWLEGLFAGIQATLWSQQAAAASQLQEIRMRAIEAQRRDPGEPTPPGQYI